MTKLVNDVEEKILAGRYNIKVNVASGTCDLQYSVEDGDGFNTIDGTVISASQTNTADLPNCKIKYVQSGGTSEVWINRID